MTDWDLVIIVPSRGRPAGLARLFAACEATLAKPEATLVAVGLDDDDPQLDAYLGLLYPPHMLGGVRVGAGRTLLRGGLLEVAPRMTLAAWTNRFAAALAPKAGLVASLGDDHIPQTPGWDVLLGGAIASRPGAIGIAYGNDLLQGEHLPTAAVMSARIVEALGWMCAPGLRHYYVDDAWRDLGRAAGCLAYCPDVIIQHAHPAGGPALARWDDTYTDAAAGAAMGLDHAAYQAWREGCLPEAAATVRQLAERGQPR